MKIIVATKEMQGQRKNDFCWVPEGEIVHFSFECDGETVDGSCGCRRSMAGVECNKSTTTMKVVELPVLEETLLFQLRDHYIKNWKMSVARAVKLAKEEVQDLIDMAAAFQLGAIIEKRGETFQARKSS